MSATGEGFSRTVRRALARSGHSKRMADDALDAAMRALYRAVHDCEIAVLEARRERNRLASKRETMKKTT